MVTQWRTNIVLTHVWNHFPFPFQTKWRSSLLFMAIKGKGLKLENTTELPSSFQLAISLFSLSYWPPFLIVPPPLWLTDPIFWPRHVPLPVLEDYEGHMLPSLHSSWPHCIRLRDQRAPEYCCVTLVSRDGIFGSLFEYTCVCQSRDHGRITAF